MRERHREEDEKKNIIFEYVHRLQPFDQLKGSQYDFEEHKNPSHSTQVHLA